MKKNEIEELKKLCEILSPYCTVGSNMIQRKFALRAMKEWGDKRFEEGRDKALEAVPDYVLKKMMGKYGDLSTVRYLELRSEILSLKTHKDLQP